MAENYSDDFELYSVMKQELFTAVVGDVMDTLGFLHQFLPPEIKPLRDDMVLVGRAMTVLEADYHTEPGISGPGPLGAKPFGLMFEALDDLKQGIGFSHIKIFLALSPKHGFLDQPKDCLGQNQNKEHHDQGHDANRVIARMYELEIENLVDEFHGDPILGI